MKDEYPILLKTITRLCFQEYTTAEPDPDSAEFTALAPTP